MFYVLFEHCFTFELFRLMTTKLKLILTYLHLQLLAELAELALQLSARL